MRAWPGLEDSSDTDTDSFEFDKEEYKYRIVFHYFDSKALNHVQAPATIRPGPSR